MAGALTIGQGRAVTNLAPCSPFLGKSFPENELAGHPAPATTVLVHINIQRTDLTTAELRLRAASSPNLHCISSAVKAHLSRTQVHQHGRRQQIAFPDQEVGVAWVIGGCVVLWVTSAMGGHPLADGHRGGAPWWPVGGAFCNVGGCVGVVSVRAVLVFQTDL